MKRYLQPINDASKFRDAADYPGENLPFPAPEGFAWMAGDPPSEAEPYKPANITQELKHDFEVNLTPEQQADLAILKAAVKLELEQGRIEIAKLIIQRAVIPAALESVRQALLARFHS